MFVAEGVVFLLVHLAPESSSSSDVDVLVT